MPSKCWAMIDVTYSETFLKDIKKLKSTPYFQKIKTICFDELPDYANIKQIKNLKKIVGHKNFFRIEIVDYRVGIQITGNSVKVLRVMHRKEIYKYFP